jgi:signal transduction histidine kinase
MSQSQLIMLGGATALVVLVAVVLLLRGRRPAADPVAALALGLTHVDDRRGVAEAVAQALRQLGADNIYLTYRDVGDDGGHPVMRCLHAPEQPSALPLPQSFAPGEFEPLRRALASGELAAADDVVALAAKAVAQSAADRRAEAHFWQHYGVDLLMPARRVAEGLEPDGELLAAVFCAGAHRAEQRKRVRELALLYVSALARVLQLERLEQARRGLQREAETRAERLRNTMGVLEDAQSQLVEAEKQAMLGRLVAGIVHEINSPLGTIGSSVDTLLRAIERYRPFVADQVEALGQQGKAGQKALRAIDQQKQLVSVLAQSRARIEEVLARLQRFVGLDAAEIKPLDLGDALRDAIALVRPTAGEAIEIVSELPEQAPAIPCYPSKLNQVFLNLIQNAVDALEGQGTLRIEMEVGERQVVISFVDTGRGIAAGKLGQVLDFGFTTKLGGRVGLRMGLPASNQAVNELGGRLSINSELGRGTTVTVTLPLDSTPLTAKARSAGRG